MKLFDRLFAKPARDLEAELAAALAALADRLARVCGERDAAYRREVILLEIQAQANATLSRYGAALDTIGATESRNGTAQRLARLAREARE